MIDRWCCIVQNICNVAVKIKEGKVALFTRLHCSLIVIMLLCSLQVGNVVLFTTIKYVSYSPKGRSRCIVQQGKSCSRLQALSMKTGHQRQVIVYCLMFVRKANLNTHKQKTWPCLMWSKLVSSKVGHVGQHCEVGNTAMFT